MPVQTLTDLRDERARVLTAIDDILNTAKERPEAERAFTDEERTEHAALEAQIATLDAEISRAVQLDEFDTALATQASRSEAPSVNLNRDTVREGRSLDELLWATAERAGHNPVDQVLVRSNDVETLAPRLNEFRPGDHGAIRSFQQTVADMCLFGMMVDRSVKTSSEGFQVARDHKLYKDRWSHIVRAMDTDTSAEGTDWIPTGIGANLHEKVRALGKVAPLFQRINLPTNPWKWPIEGADATAYRIAEPTSDTESKMTASTPGSVVATFDAEIFGARALFSRSLEADSAIAILPYVKRKLALAFAVAEEKAILDGDTDGTHQDSDIGASTTAAVTAWDGLRKKGLAQTVATATSASVTNLAAVRKAMTKWGLNPADLAFIVGVSNMHGLLADTNLLTVDKYGPNAIVHTGEIGSVFGVPVIASEYVRENLNASGVYDGITTSKTYMLCVNVNEWAIGQRAALDVQVDDSIYRETYQRVVVAFQREDFQNIGDAATNEDTAIAYNVTP